MIFFRWEQSAAAFHLATVTERKWWGSAVMEYNLTEVATKKTHKLFDGSEGNSEILMAIEKVL